jgi:hypothetical protein
VLNFPAGIWAVDFEFTADPGERQVPICMVARELRSGRTIRLWQDQFGRVAPFPVGADAVFVAYYASAELGCFRALGWPIPARILDLCAEFRDRTSGLERPNGSSLLGALSYFGLDGIGATEKQEMRGLALRGGPYDAAEQIALLDYCESDVAALQRLLPAMLPEIDLPRALLRGRYMAAAAAMEFAGVPVDVETLALLRDHWTGLQGDLIAAIDADYGVFDGRTFKIERWAQWLARNNIPWPLLESGQVDLSDDTFREMAKAHPAVSPMRELRSALSSLRLADLAVGRDGRNRTLLGAFGSKTGRNQPSNAKYIFGPSVWLRGLIQPQPGCGIAYVDWSHQEFGIAAALSGDRNMQDAYRSEDCYIEFGRQAGVIPPDATKQTHKGQRQLLKTCVLGVQYGMEARTLALRISQPTIVARDLLRAHRETYPAFWRWSDAVVDHAMLAGSLHTVFGWHVHIGPESNPRSLRNFPMQANGAEMMRLAACLATERGIEVCAPIHDAFLIHAPLDRLEADVTKMRAAMAEASRVVLGGFELATDAKLIRHPERYMDEDRGRVMWDRVMNLVAARQAMPARGIEFDNEAVERMVAFAQERREIKLRKDAGQPKPLTSWPILRDNRFCNFNREDDATTVGIAKNWREPHADDHDCWFAMVVARFINKFSTLALLGYPVPWDREHFLTNMAAIETPYGAAYMIPGGAKGVPKPVHQADEVFGPLWDAREYVRPRAGDTLQAFFTRLRQFRDMGTFLAGQVVADVKYIEPLKSAPDWHTWATSGPGSRRGLNRLLGRDKNTPWDEADWRRTLRQLQ